VDKKKNVLDLLVKF